MKDNPTGSRMMILGVVLGNAALAGLVICGFVYLLQQAQGA